MKEFWDVYDADGNLISDRVKERGKHDLAPDEYHLVVFAWIINDKSRYAPKLLQFCNVLSSDMNLLQQKTVLKEADNAFFRTAFCLSAILSKTCFSGRQTKLTEVGIIPHTAYFSS